MPLTQAVTYPIFASNLAPAFVVGPSSFNLISALSNSLFFYSLNGIKVSTFDSGSAGVGSGNATGVVFPVGPSQKIFIENFIASGITGVLSVAVATQIATAYSICFS